MGWFIFWAIIFVAVVSFVVSSSQETAKAADQRAKTAKRERELRDKRDKAQSDKLTYLGELAKDGWSSPDLCSVNSQQSWITRSPDGLRLISFKDYWAFEVVDERLIPVHQILEAALSKDDKIVNYLRKEITPITVSQKKSPVARGLVGGLLLGPAGLVLGAASGVATTSKVVNHETTVEDSRIVKGPPVLTIGVADPENPMAKIEFANDNDAEKWVYWIKAILAQK